MKERPGYLSEFLRFVREDRAYWIVPVLLVLAVLIALAVLGIRAASPFLYDTL